MGELLAIELVRYRLFLYICTIYSLFYAGCENMVANHSFSGNGVHLGTWILGLGL